MNLQLEEKTTNIQSLIKISYIGSNLNMFARSALKFGKPVVQTGRRNMSVPTFLYNNVWEKSTAKYISYVVVTLVIADLGYHKFFDVLWDANNKGVG